MEILTANAKLLNLEHYDNSLNINIIQRTFEIVFSLIILILVSPLILLIIILIKLINPGPAFYHGERVGRNGKVFRIYKFRTLRHNAEKQIGATLMQSDSHCHSILGSLLRKTKLDELPQFYNVIKGDMNIIGPRPERPVRAEIFFRTIPGYANRFRVKPGLTGLAQIRGNYYTHARNKLRYEVLYIKHRSFIFDLKLLFQTIFKVIIPPIELSGLKSRSCLKIYFLSNKRKQLQIE